MLIENGLGTDQAKISLLILHRKGEEFIFTLDDLLNLEGEKVYIQPGDRISAEILNYKENKVFILGGVSPQIFTINPANRETLADILFTNGGIKLSHC